jgi:hypothetical protein
MYCAACGQQLIPGAAACPRCGRLAGAAAPAAAAVPVPFFYNRVRRHIQALSILWIAYAVWTLFAFAMALPFLAGFSRQWWFFSGPQHFWLGERMPWLLPFITVMLLFRVILSAVTGIALLQRQPWARVLAIVAAVLTVFKPITGTALAIYTLWVMAPGLSGQEWSEMTRRPGL